MNKKLRVERGHMDSVKSRAEAYLGIALILLGFWRLPPNGIELLVLAILFFMISLLLFWSSKFRNRWLRKVTEKVTEGLGHVHISHIVLFLGLVSLALSLLTTNAVQIGIIIVVLAYSYLLGSIGWDLAPKLWGIWDKKFR
jgi:dolichol kinase